MRAHQRGDAADLERRDMLQGLAQPCWPDGEQLEFVQALGPVKQVFDSALLARRNAVAG
jgi:hypothetical protein